MYLSKFQIVSLKKKENKFVQITKCISECLARWGAKYFSRDMSVDMPLCAECFIPNFTSTEELVLCLKIKMNIEYGI